MITTQVVAKALSRRVITQIENTLDLAALEGAAVNEPLVEEGLLRRKGAYLELTPQTYKSLKASKAGARAIRLAQHNREEALLPEELSARRRAYAKLTSEENEHYPHSILTKEEFKELQEGAISMGRAVFGEIRVLEISHACPDPQSPGGLLLLALDACGTSIPYKTGFDDSAWAEPINGSTTELATITEQIQKEATARALEVAQTQYCVCEN